MRKVGTTRPPFICRRIASQRRLVVRSKSMPWPKRSTAVVSSRPSIKSAAMSGLSQGSDTWRPTLSRARSSAALPRRRSPSSRCTKEASVTDLLRRLDMSIDGFEHVSEEWPNWPKPVEIGQFGQNETELANAVEQAKALVNNNENRSLASLANWASQKQDSRGSTDCVDPAQPSAGRARESYISMAKVAKVANASVS